VEKLKNKKSETVKNVVNKRFIINRYYFWTDYVNKLN
jgi:hypothetical protein